MRSPISALAHDEIVDSSIASPVTNATDPATDTTESVVREATLLLIEVDA
ncbi:hypothetical protein [Halorubrum sp. HHNYT27]